MKLARCNNGHFYDGDIYQVCPHCSGRNNGNEQSDNKEAERPNKTRSIFNIKSFSDRKDKKEIEEKRGTLQSDNLEGSSLQLEVDKLNRTVRFDSAQNEIEEKETDTVPVENERKELEKIYSREEEVIYHEPISDNSKTVSISGRKDDAKEPVVGWLVGLNGEVYGEGFPLYSGMNFIGRELDMDICIRGDRSVSRNKHAVVVFDPKSRKFMVKPGESKSLFYLNGEVVLETMVIENGCILTVGETKMRFVALCGDDFSWNGEMID